MIFDMNLESLSCKARKVVGFWLKFKPQEQARQSIHILIGS